VVVWKLSLLALLTLITAALTVLIAMTGPADAATAVSPLISHARDAVTWGQHTTISGHVSRGAHVLQA
jgi:hypothetical protein